MNRRTTKVWAHAALLAVLGTAAAHGSQVSLNAADVLPADVLSGPRHSVATPVQVHTHMAQVRIESEFGTFEAPSVDLARTRIRELDAIAHLKEISRSEMFVDAMGASLQRKGQTAKRVVEDPGGTAAAAGRAVGNLFGRAKRGVQDVASDDDDGDEGGEGDSATDVAASTGKDVIGYSAAIRKIAQSAAADPYSTNEVLQEELDRLAQAMVAGGMATNIVLPTVPVVSRMLSTATLVYSLSEEDLRARNEAALTAMGVPPEDARALLTRGAFGPSVATALVSTLEALPQLGDRAALVQIALEAGTEMEARRYVQSARLLKLANDSSRALVRAVPTFSAMAAVDAAGVLIVAAPVDYLALDADVEHAIATAPAGTKELWLTGVIEARALRELQGRGWIVRARINLES